MYKVFNNEIKYLEQSQNKKQMETDGFFRGWGFGLILISSDTKKPKGQFSLSKPHSNLHLSAAVFYNYSLSFFSRLAI